MSVGPWDSAVLPSTKKHPLCWHLPRSSVKTSSKTASLYSWRKRHHHLKETSNSCEQCSPHRHQSGAEGLCLYPSTKIHYCHTEPRQAPGMRSWVCRRKASKTHWCDWMVSQLGGFYDCFCQAYWAVLSLSNLTQLQLVTTPIPTHAGGRSAPRVLCTSVSLFQVLLHVSLSPAGLRHHPPLAALPATGKQTLSPPRARNTVWSTGMAQSQPCAETRRVSLHTELLLWHGHKHRGEKVQFTSNIKGKTEVW